MTTYYLDSSAIIDASKSGIGAWNGSGTPPPGWDRFLDDFKALDGRIVINEIIYNEATRNTSYPDAIAAKQWIDAAIADGSIEFQPMTQAQIDAYTGGNIGERALIDTAQDPIYGASVDDVRIVTSDSFTNKPFWTQSPFNNSNLRDIPQIYEERFFQNGSEIDYYNGRDFSNSARDAVRNVRIAEFGGTDIFNSMPFDENGFMNRPSLPNTHWSDLPTWLRGNMLRAAGELVGAAAITLDAWQTQHAFAEAMSRGDLASADDLLGGLIGRAFGGAFAATVTAGITGAIWGGTFGGPAAALLGAILGGIIGAIGGGEAGEWFFGALHDLGWSISNFVEDMSAFLRHLRSDPIVLDLDGDGIELISTDSSTILFDLDGDSQVERVGWVNSQDGFLVQDLNHDGIANDVSELFGGANVDGFDELAALDSNHDGKIDTFDPAFQDLLIWHDLNQDGISSADEIISLMQAGVAWFNLAYISTDQEIDGNTIARTGSYRLSSGADHGMASVWLGMDKSLNRPDIPAGANVGNIQILPNLPAAGAMPDLRTAMYFDPILKSMVENFVSGDHDFDDFAAFAGWHVLHDGSHTVLEGGFVDLLARWAGVEISEAQAPDSPYYVQMLEAFTGVSLDGSTEPQLEQLERMWADLVQQLGVRFLVQAASGPQLVPLYQISSDVAALDPSDPDYLSDLSSITEGAVLEGASIVPAYDYLNPFTMLDFNPSTGELYGDFDSFVTTIVQDEPSFVTNTTGGYGRITMRPGEYNDNRHPWTAWYEDQGSILFYVADAMGISSDYVLNATGWRWLFGEMTDHYGTANVDVIDKNITFYEQTVSTAGPNGWSVAVIQVPTYDQLIFGYEGADHLIGNNGVDRLVGGSGNDLLEGGTDSDMYVYADGDGLDRIVDASGSEDAVYFSSELDAADLRVTRLSGTDDLQIYFNSTATGIILTGQWISPVNSIEQFHFVAEDGLNASDIASGIWQRSSQTALTRSTGVGRTKPLTAWPAMMSFLGMTATT